MNLIEKASALALVAHADQRRKEEDVPYMVHPIAVALILAQYGFDETVCAAALVHDVLEDTTVTPEELEERLGAEVADLVLCVTHDSSLSWKQKKQGYIDTLRGAPEKAKAIATADKIANIRSLIAAYEKNGPTIWEQFNASKKDKLWFEESMLTMLKENWEHPLVDLYGEHIEMLKRSM